MKIAIGSDHAGYSYKEEIKRVLKENGHALQDFGAPSDDPVDYPLFIRPVAEAVSRGEYDRGIVLGGSGNGEAIAANRVHGIRCALCWNLETAILARRHNNANMLSLGARIISIEQALEIVKAWLDTPFDAGRHLRRILQIDQKTPQKSPSGMPQKNLAFGTGEKTVTTEPEEETTGTEKYDLLISFQSIKYMEGKNSLEFEVDPGLKRPSIVHIPSPESWKAQIPLWARERRQEILDRIMPKCSHINCEWKED